MNFSFSNLVIGIIGVVVGVFLVKDAFYLNHHILFLGWVEQKWGPGMGTTAYKFVGIGLIVFSVLVGLGQINLTSDNLQNSKKTQNINTTTTTPLSPSNGQSIIAP